MNLLSEAAGTPGAEQLGEVVNNSIGQTTAGITNIVGDPVVLVIGLGLIVLTLIIIFFIKKIIINSVLGMAAWVIAVFFFHIELPLLPSFVLSAVFGLAGIGAILILKFLGLAF